MSTESSSFKGYVNGDMNRPRYDAKGDGVGSKEKLTAKGDNIPLSQEIPEQELLLLRALEGGESLSARDLVKKLRESEAFGDLPNSAIPKIVVAIRSRFGQDSILFEEMKYKSVSDRIRDVLGSNVSEE